MTRLQEFVDGPVADGRLAGAVALIATTDGDREVAVAGRQAFGGAPMTRDSVFRIASITKPITAAATMALVDRGVLELDAEVRRWLPELADPPVLRRPDGPLDDTEPIERPITVRDLLGFGGGHGFIADFGAPVMAALFGELLQGPPAPAQVPPPAEWLRRLARIPLVHQPGRGWTYNTGADILGVLLSRATEQPLDRVFAELLFEPLGMTDTDFTTPRGGAARMTSLYRGSTLVDGPDGQWSHPPAFPSGAGGLVSTAADWCAFGLMLLNGGRYRGRSVLTEESVRLMTSPQHVAEPGNMFLQDQAWGFGGSVDIVTPEPWNVVGRYGWIGGTGTAGYIYPGAGTVAVWLGQRELQGPDDSDLIGDFLGDVADRVAARHGSQPTRPRSSE
ncbi:serine hydrolase domain-containing protein [Skermania piniformis]|uniref:Beta-lactamase family protein n=1 Tax=Skermania pinensis TaxID=39122 RepID=A0ABX8S8B5_9ACTN|nr:serine hydrolase domain-containing protein [Skermania piniformis]QXQ14008.1 beta-lactamase family protein [Skermania piniformis]